MKSSLLIISYLLLSTLPALSATSQKKGANTIPFKFDNDYIYIEGKLCDSMPGRFIYDTGAGATLIGHAFMDRYNFRLPAYDSVTIQGFGDREQTALFTTAPLCFTFNNARFYSTRSLIYEMSDIIPGVDCVLGAAIWGDNIYKIDYAAQQITILSRPQMRAMTKDWERIPFRRSEEGLFDIQTDLIFDSIRAKEVRTFVRIDTGNPQTISLTPNAETASQLSRTINNSIDYKLAIIGVGGGGNVTIAQSEAIRIGKYTVPLPFVSIINSSVLNNTPCDGTLGNDILALFDIIIDVNSGFIYLHPNNTEPQQQNISYSGFLISTIGGNYIVNGLSRRNIGLRHNDIITHINEIDVKRINYNQIYEFLATPDLEYTLDIVRDGKEIKIEIKNLNKITLWQ